jgi:hypothetical protein
MSDALDSAITVGTPKAIWRVLQAIRTQALYLVPVDNGDLKKSITAVYQTQKSGDGWFLNAPISKNEGIVGSNLEYAAAVEYGRPDMPNYPAQPYLRPSAELIKAKLNNTFTEELNKSIMEMARVRRSNSLLKQRGINR